MEFTFNEMCEKLKKKENFTFSRWGDGEWQCILTPVGRNCDGHEYTKCLSEALQAVLLSKPTYYMGMQPKAMRDMGKRIMLWLQNNGLTFDWVNSDIIHEASAEEYMWDIKYALQDRKVICVMPNRLKKVANMLKAPCVNVPLKNAWKWYHTIYGDLMDEIDKDAVILYCSGMPTEVMMHHIWNDYKDTVTQIDVGSAFDPYCGFKTRRYHKMIIERLER